MVGRWFISFWNGPNLQGTLHFIFGSVTFGVFTEMPSCFLKMALKMVEKSPSKHLQYWEKTPTSGKWEVSFKLHGPLVIMEKMISKASICMWWLLNGIFGSVSTCVNARKVCFLKRNQFTWFLQTITHFFRNPDHLFQHHRFLFTTTKTPALG